MAEMAMHEFNVHFDLNRITPRGSIIYVNDQEVKIHYGLLESNIFRDVRELDYDVFTIIAAIEFADKKVKRKFLEKWGRNLSITIPVSCPDLWNSDSVLKPLTNCLHLLTGDVWDIRFILRNFPLAKREDPFLSLSCIGDKAIMPYSDGLDSFAFGQLLKSDRPELNQLRVTSWNRSLHKQDQSKCEDGLFRIPIPISVSTVRHAETSFRTRPFKFLMLCAIVAGLTESYDVYIPENGQGSIGPSLFTKGVEWTYWGSHPVFTSALKNFIKAALDYDINFIHPHIWLTKGQVLKMLLDVNGSWISSMSCSRDVRQQMSIDGTRVHCGVCSNCLLRRVSLHTAGLESQAETYIWPKLDSLDLESGAHSSFARNVSKNDRDIAYCSVVALDGLAKFMGNRLADHIINKRAYQLENANFCSADKAKTKTLDLLKQHEMEWLDFTNSISKPSWFHDLLETLQ